MTGIEYPLTVKVENMDIRLQDETGNQINENIKSGEEITIRINCEECTFFPSIEDSPKTMSMVIEILAEAGSATRIIIMQKNKKKNRSNKPVPIYFLQFV